MNTTQTIDSTLAILTNCYGAGVTATCTARLLSYMGDYTHTQDLMAAVYVDTLQCKAGLNDDVYKFARAVLTKLEQGWI